MKYIYIHIYIYIILYVIRGSLHANQQNHHMSPGLHPG